MLLESTLIILATCTLRFPFRLAATMIEILSLLTPRLVLHHYDYYMVLFQDFYHL